MCYQYLLFTAYAKFVSVDILCSTENISNLRETLLYFYQREFVVNVFALFLSFISMNCHKWLATCLWICLEVNTRAIICTINCCSFSWQVSQYFNLIGCYLLFSTTFASLLVNAKFKLIFNLLKRSNKYFIFVKIFFICQSLSVNLFGWGLRH